MDITQGMAKVAPELLEAWQMNGNTIILVSTHLSIPLEVVAALTEQIGITPDDNVGAIAYASGDEWNGEVISLMVEGDALKFGVKPRLR